MAQLYLQRFAYLGSTKAEFDGAWEIPLQSFAKSGNWGGVEEGVRHIKTYGTAWGGYAARRGQQRGIRSVSGPPQSVLRPYGSRHFRTTFRPGRGSRGQNRRNKALTAQ